MLRDLREDLKRYRGAGRAWAVWKNPAVWAVAWYRFGRWAHHEQPWGPVRPLAKALHAIGYLWLQVFMDMHLDPSAKIGPGLYLGHCGGAHINPEAVIGAHCDLGHYVTIGTSARGRAGAPVLGDNVYVGVGATIVGKIRVGDGAKIAANTLVISHVPAGATVMGVPGRIVMRPAAAAAGAGSAGTKTEGN